VHITANDLDHKRCPPAPYHTFLAAPQQATDVPAWQAAQSGPPPPSTQPDPACTLGTIPSAACSSHALTLHSRHHQLHRQWYNPSTLVIPWLLGPTSNHYPAPVQLYLISYPLGPWPPLPAVLAGPHGHGEEDSGNC